MTVTSSPKAEASPRNALRIVHSSDVHVSEDFTEPVHRGDGTAGLRVVLAAARTLGADVTILAGDTFENNRLSDALVARATALLAAAGMPVVILPGNHDPVMAQSVFHRGVAAPANVHVLGLHSDGPIFFPELGLDVWGRAHRDYSDMAPLEDPHPRRNAWHIAMAHGHYEPKPNRATKLRPAWLIGDAEIEATAADYVALGHWNRYVQVGTGAIAAYYSGSPDFAGTVNLVELTASGEVVVSRAPVDWDR